jgi:hypothetical protein
LPLEQAATARCGSPRLDVRRLKMLGERLVIRPQFRKADESGLEWIEGNVICDATIVPSRGFDQLS